MRKISHMDIILQFNYYDRFKNKLLLENTKKNIHLNCEGGN